MTFLRIRWSSFALFPALALVLLEPKLQYHDDGKWLATVWHGFPALDFLQNLVDFIVNFASRQIDSRIVPSEC
jgi:hypothetical protein